jgi:hypothetical protein
MNENKRQYCLRAKGKINENELKKAIDEGGCIKRSRNTIKTKSSIKISKLKELETNNEEQRKAYSEQQAKIESKREKNSKVNTLLINK